jgi:hypothetical protein
LTRIAFELVGNKPLLPVRVDGRGPYAFLLDNGSSYDVIDTAVAAELELEVTPFEALSGAGEGTLESGTAGGVVLGVDGTDVATEEILVLPLSDAIAGGSGRRIDGLLGFPFFSRHAVELCYDGAQLALHPSHDGAWRGSRVPIELRREHAIADGTLELRDGRRVTGRFMVDTAFRSAVVLTRPFAAEHAVAETFARPLLATTGWGIGGPTRDVVGRVRSFKLGELCFDAPLVCCSTARAGVLAESSFAGIIGGELLRRCHTVVDYGARELVLEPGDAWDDPHEFDQSGLFLVAEGDALRRFVVYDVIPESPAARAGVVRGDALIRIGDVETGGLELEEVRALLRAGPGTTYRLAFERLGAVRLTLRRLV